MFTHQLWVILSVADKFVSYKSYCGRWIKFHLQYEVCSWLLLCYERKYLQFKCCALYHLNAQCVVTTTLVTWEIGLSGLPTSSLIHILSKETDAGYNNLTWQCYKMGLSTSKNCQLWSVGEPVQTSITSPSLGCMLTGQIYPCKYLLVMLKCILTLAIRDVND